MSSGFLVVVVFVVVFLAGAFLAAVVFLAVVAFLTVVAFLAGASLTSSLVSSLTGVSTTGVDSSATCPSSTF